MDDAGGGRRGTRPRLSASSSEAIEREYGVSLSGATDLGGSANLNRRSFTCDSEIACAVLDPAVVLTQQTQLWSYLFDGAARPNVDLSTTGGGKQLFDAFRDAVNNNPSILIPDPWRDADPTLPNGLKRDQSPLAFGTQYESFLDPSSVTTTVERVVYDPASPGSHREPNLDDVVGRLEFYHLGLRYPYRRP